MSDSKVVKTRVPPNAGKGRKKGTPNKMTAMAKDAIAYAAERLGGGDRLVAWAQEDPANERVFWGTIYPKLLPLQVANADGESFKVEEIVRRVIDPRNDNGQP